MYNCDFCCYETSCLSTFTCHKETNKHKKNELSYQENKKINEKYAIERREKDKEFLLIIKQCKDEHKQLKNDKKNLIDQIEKANKDYNDLKEHFIKKIKE